MVRAKTLRELVSELMNLSAMETGKFILKRVALDLAGVVREAVDLNRDKARSKDLALDYCAQAGPAGATALADREAMLMVFGNLIDNAIKYTPDHGHVSVRVEQTDNYIKVLVKDDGIGMSPEEQDKLFEEFFRARNRYTAKVPGTGLGLALTRRLVELHQGKITVITAPGQGSTFTVWVPKQQ